MKMKPFGTGKKAKLKIALISLPVLMTFAYFAIVQTKLVQSPRTALNQVNQIVSYIVVQSKLAAANLRNQDSSETICDRLINLDEKMHILSMYNFTTDRSIIQKTQEMKKLIQNTANICISNESTTQNLAGTLPESMIEDLNLIGSLASDISSYLQNLHPEQVDALFPVQVLHPMPLPNAPLPKY